MLTWYNVNMKNISIQLEEDLFKKFAVACAELGIQKKAVILSFIKNFLEGEEDKEILNIAQKRLKEYEKKKIKTISHKDAWK